jgi:hypothetical protein
MAIERTFRMKTTAAALSGLMVLSAAMPFAVSAQGPDSTRPAATQPANTTAPAAQLGPIEKAAQYSKQGVGILVIIGNGDTVANHKENLASMMRVLNQENIPAQIFGMTSSQPNSRAIFIVDGVTYNGQKDHATDFNQGYSLNQPGTIIADAKRAYTEAFESR